MEGHDIERILAPLLAGELAAWRGLPELSRAELVAALGEPERSDEAQVGAYPAERLEYAGDPSAPALAAFVRDDRLIMVEVVPAPEFSVLAELPEPTAILPQEIDVDGAYAHEYLYCERGLLLTVAQTLGRPEPDRLVRCRGVRPLAEPADLGAELYMPLEAQVKW